jgi:hypothetical protein
MRQNEMAHNMFITRGRGFDVKRPGLSADADVHYGKIYETLRVFLWAREPAFGIQAILVERKPIAWAMIDDDFS